MDGLKDWLFSSGLRIAIYVGVTWLVLHFGMRIIRKIIHKSVEADPSTNSQRALELRENTLVKILGSIFKITTLFIGSMLVLSELGVNMAPLFAGAGIFSLAIGFGAQDLVKDIVAGIFILVENQYRVGDIVELENISGKVEKMTLRVTVLRDLDGNVHYIPNGSVEMTTNKTMDYSKVNLDIGVSYSEDIDRVEKIVNQVGEKLAQDKEWKDKITEAPHFLRVSELGDSSIEIKIIGETKPNEQWGVTGELRRRIVKAFEKENIEIPFPQMVVHETRK